MTLYEESDYAFRVYDIPTSYETALGYCKDLKGPVMTFEEDRELYLMRVRIAGTTFVDGFNKIMSGIDAGSPVILEREPDNRYDGNAIRICTEDGDKLGYIPQERNKYLAMIMDSGADIRGRITDKTGFAPTVEVTMVTRGPLVMWKEGETYTFGSRTFAENGPFAEYEGFKDMFGSRSMPYRRAFSDDQLYLLKWGHDAYEMEDRWRLFYNDGVLNICRSWTGICVFKIVLGESDVHELIWNTECYRDMDEGRILEMVDELLDNYVEYGAFLAFLRPYKEGSILISAGIYMD